MKLNELRKRWENNVDNLLVLPLVIDDYPVIYVMVKNKVGQFSLFRYFPIISNWIETWEISVDLSNQSSPDKIYEYLNKAFEQNLPKKFYS